HRNRKKSLVLTGIDVEKNLAARFELSLKQVVEEKIPFVSSPSDRFISTTMERGRKGGDQIKFPAEIRQRLKRLDTPDLSLETEKIDQLVANRVVAHVETESGMAELFGDEQKETAAAAEIENFLRTGPIQLQLPDARDGSSEPALDVVVRRGLAGGRSVARLNIAQAFLVDLR